MHHDGHRCTRVGRRYVCMFICACVVLALLAPACRAHSAMDQYTAKLQRRAFDLMWKTAHPKTGLVADAVDYHTGKPVGWSSIAGVGFMLASLPVGVERGWVDKPAAAARAQLVLKELLDHSPNKHGWMYHFIEMDTLQRAGRSEVSSIDTALLAAGGLVAGQYFDGDVKKLADQLYHRIDFPWMLHDGGASPKSQTFNLAWTDEGGFSPYRYSRYCEIMILYQLGIGSPTHPVSPDCWRAFERPISTYQGRTTFAAGPLFTHEFSHLFIDFRNRRDPLGYNYFTASVNAVRNDRAFCTTLAGKSKTFDDNVWGLSACLGPDGYTAYGFTPAPARSHHDNTVAPWSTATAIMFCPQLAEQSLAHMIDRFGDKVFGPFGLVESFNVDRNWYSPRITSIDAGAALLAIENHRSGLIWKLYMADADVQHAMHRIGFVEDRRTAFFIPPGGAERVVAEAEPAGRASAGLPASPAAAVATPPAAAPHKP